jgi:hypothetical protein
MFPDPSGGKYLNGGFKREKASAENPRNASRQALGWERIFGKLFLLVLVLVLDSSKSFFEDEGRAVSVTLCRAKERGRGRLFWSITRLPIIALWCKVCGYGNKLGG